MRLGFDGRIIEGSGVGTYSRNLLTQLARFDLDLVVFCTDRGKGAVPSSDRTSLVSANINPETRSGKARFATLVRAVGVDVLHVPTYMSPGNTTFPVVATVHDVIPLVYPRSVRNPLARARYRRQLDTTLEESELIITVSGISRSALIAHAGVDPERIRVVQNGVSDQFSPVSDEQTLASVRNRYHLPDRFALWIGEFRPQKNLEVLVKGWAKLRDMNEEVPDLVLAGAQDGEFRKIRREVKRRKLEEKVWFPGYIRQDDLPALYSAAEVFIFPSLFEGFGLPPLEAMACGTPCVVSNSSSLPEATGRAAYMFNPTSAEELAEVVHRVLTDDALRERLREEGREQAGLFSWEKSAERTLEIYREIVR